MVQFHASFYGTIALTYFTFFAYSLPTSNAPSSSNASPGDDSLDSTTTAARAITYSPIPLHPLPNYPNRIGYTLQIRGFNRDGLQSKSLDPGYTQDIFSKFDAVANKQIQSDKILITGGFLDASWGSVELSIHNLVVKQKADLDWVLASMAVRGLASALEDKDDYECKIFVISNQAGQSVASGTLLPTMFSRANFGVATSWGVTSG